LVRREEIKDFHAFAKEEFHPKFTEGLMNVSSLLQACAGVRFAGVASSNFFFRILPKALKTLSRAGCMWIPRLRAGLLASSSLLEVVSSHLSTPSSKPRSTTSPCTVDASQADVNVRTERDNTPLMYAAAQGSLRVFEALMGAGASLAVTNDNGDTPLMWACTKGNPDIVHALLSEETTDVLAPNLAGLTPLMCAVVGGEMEVVRPLLAAIQAHTEAKGFANNINMCNKYGSTALHMAAEVAAADCSSLISRCRLGTLP
jgi:ankyrin repeat protein